MSITATERTQIIELTTLMFNAAPGATYLSQIVALYEANGHKIDVLAAQLAQTSIYQSMNPTFQTSAEFATKFLTPLGLQNDAIATDFIISRLNAGQSKASVVYAAFQALNNIASTDAAQYQNAKAILTNKTAVAEYYSATLLGSATDLTTLQNAISSVTADPATVQAAEQQLQSVTGQTFNLATAAEQVSGTAGNDTFNGSDTTLVLDVLNGLDGVDSLNYSDATGGVDINGLGLSLNSVEVINARSTGAATLTTTGFTGVTDVNVKLGAATTVVAGATTNVSVSGATGAITIDGGNNVVVSDATADQDIVIGATTVNAGNVSVTDTNVGTADVKVDGGKAVTLTLTGANGGGVITVGQGGATTDLPSGAIAISSANKAVAGTDETLDNITVTGGSTVSVAQTATSSVAATDTTGATVTQGDVTITAGSATTSVSVAQTKSTAEVVGALAAAGTTETASVKFSALTAGQTVILGGLTFTATTALTAAQAAAAFANLIKSDTQGSATAAQGTYTGTLAGWTSAAASGDTVVFTSTTKNSNVADLANTGTGSVAITVAPGASATAAVTGVLGVANGTVVIDDNATAASITTVSVDGYGNASTIGATTTLSKLANLTLANSGSTGTAGETDAGMTVDAAGVASLNVTVSAVKGAVSLDGAADSALKTLNLTTTGSKSSFALTAASVETLAVSGTTSVSLTADLAAVKTVTVSGSAGLTLSGSEDNTLTSVNTTATTGKVTASIDGGLATYTGGAGQDIVTLKTTTALTKAIDLGAGDDTLSFGTLSVSGSTAAVNGGDGTDTLSMSTTAADALDNSLQSFYTNFERLTLNNKFGTADATPDALTLNLANLGFTNYVTTSGTQVNGVGGATATDVLTLDKMSSGGTVVLTAQGSIAVNVADAATGTADVLSAVVNATTADLTAGTLTVANVETINLAANDTTLDNDGDGADDAVNTVTMTLTADKATALHLTGNANLALTLTGSTKVTAIDGGSLTGALTVTSVNTTSATTITGGAGGDSLTAANGTTADVLLGGAGNDTLTANAGLDTLTGGAGNDKFVIGTASLNVNSYATITDFAAGDLIKITGADSFAAAKVTLGDTAVFQDYANAAMNSVGANDVAWFQFGGNTYIVMDVATTDSTTFINGEDVIVKLTGLVDLSTASFNDTSDTISL